MASWSLQAGSPATLRRVPASVNPPRTSTGTDRDYPGARPSALVVASRCAFGRAVNGNPALKPGLHQVSRGFADGSRSLRGCFATPKRLLGDAKNAGDFIGVRRSS